MAIPRTLGRRLVRRFAQASLLILAGFLGLGLLTSSAGAAGGDPLSPWRDALTAANGAPADILFLGDSITEGYGASSRGAWWADQVRVELQRDWGGQGVGYEGVVPAADRTFANLWTTSGGAPSATTGLGLRAHVLSTKTDQVNATVQATRLELLYTASPTGGRMEISIDGKAPTTVDTAATSETTRRWASAALASGSHTITVKAQPAKGRSVVVQGVLASGQTGVRTWNGGHAGYGSSHFVGARGWEHAAKAADPELVVIALGTNDYTFQLTAAQFKQNLSLLVDRATASATGPVSVALMPMWTGTGRDAVRYGAYVDAQRELATTRGLGLIDLSKLDASRYTSDGVHPNDLGQRAIADAVLSATNPRHTPFVLPPADPTDVVAAPGTSPGTATLTWTPPTGTVTDYTITAHDHAGPVTSYSATGTSTTITGLTPGHTYTFGIFANNAAGQSTGVASNAITLPTPLSPPADPTDVVAAPGTSPGTATLTWTPPTGTVTDYTITAHDHAGPVTSYSATGTSTTITGLTPGHTYTFGIFANNAAGQSTGVASNAITLPTPLSPPADPTDVVAAPGTSPGTATLTWTPPTGTVTDYTIVAYDLEGSPTAYSATGTTTTITGLLPGHTYVFGVYANNAAGQSPGVASNYVTLPVTLAEATTEPAATEAPTEPSPALEPALEPSLQPSP